jgi:DNA helicase II / ATP-dependent DNA helicase PcrA
VSYLRKQRKFFPLKIGHALELIKQCMSYLDELNDIQRKAVTTIHGPVMVIAGPGSGKTRVLTYRIAHLINSGVPPWQILALTFTNKAAREMKERISKVAGDKANQIWAGTFHSVFARILRTEADKSGYPTSFTIYDTDDSKNVIKNIITEKNLDPKVYVANNIKNRISSAKSNLITPKAYEANAQLRDQDRTAKCPLIHDIYSSYMIRCKKSGAMDFDDLLYQMFYLLHKNPDNVVDKYRSRFKYLLVDEFQDTNYLQYAIIRKLVNYPNSEHNLSVVGDDAQSIYAFRGATIQNILDFEKDYPQLKTFKLEQNYRSTDHIVQAANDIISHNRKQIKKEIWSDKGEGDKIKVFKTPTDRDEAKKVVDTIMEQKMRNHLSNSEIAILYRTNAQSKNFEEALRRQNIRYKVFGGLSFFQRKEVKDLIAYLRAVVNPNDEEALRRIINYPVRGIGKATIDQIGQMAAESGKTFWDGLNDHQGTRRATTNILSFMLMIDNFRKRLDKKDAYEMAVHIFEKSGIEADLKKDTTVQGIGRMENITSFLDGIKDFVENDELIDDATIPDKKLTTYLQTIALHTDADEDTDDNDKVTLMSVHSAKGLEFKSVFVVGLEDNLFPSFMSRENPEGVDEERRLFYVAVTRAERFLTLTYTQSRYRFGKLDNNIEPSRFLTEISENHLELSGVYQRERPNVAFFADSFDGEDADSSRPKYTPKRKEVQPTDIPDFQPANANLIRENLRVIHARFGAGKVLKLDGQPNNRIATIEFDQVGEKKIMLKYAKLGIE